MPHTTTIQRYADVDWTNLSIGVYDGGGNEVATTTFDWDDPFDHAAAAETGDTPDASYYDERRTVVTEALEKLGWEPVPDAEWVDLDGGLGAELGGTRIPVRTIRLDLDEVRQLLPKHTHITWITGIDVVTGEDLAYPLLWADRSYNACPRCQQAIDVDLSNDPPAMLDTGAGQGGQPLGYDQQHGCGEWLGVRWYSYRNPTLDELLNDAERLVSTRDAEISEAVNKLKKQLHADVTAALSRLAEPLAEGETYRDRLDEVSTGSEVDPGVYADDFQLIAWAYHPADNNAGPVDAVVALPK